MDLPGPFRDWLEGKSVLNQNDLDFYKAEIIKNMTLIKIRACDIHGDPIQIGDIISDNVCPYLVVAETPGQFYTIGNPKWLNDEIKAGRRNTVKEIKYVSNRVLKDHSTRVVRIRPDVISDSQRDEFLELKTRILDIHEQENNG